MNVEIAQRLAELRRQKGYSQEELAEQLGISRQAVSKWERAESSPDTDNLIALARLYGCSLDDLLAIQPVLEDDMAFEAAARARERGQQLETETSAAEAAKAASEAAREAAQAAKAASEAASATASIAGASGQRGNWQGDDEHLGLPGDGSGRQKSSLRHFPYPIVVVIVYLILAFVFGLWHPAWIIFLTIPFYYWIVGIVERDLNRKK
ncbi:MAG: helix-turn-helix transcriptional regulator [Coriobacteriales bacterium]|jgi:transcriptional regulator with XRE-family HTH domain/uncharacterized membrane protein|nr:helix-turn-helix transcriptional regulator [Coriobacteriales bacterium]